MPDRALPPDPALEQQKKRAELRRAFEARDATRLRELFGRHPEARAMIDEPLFPFDSPALAHFSGGEDVTLIDVLLEFGADPDRRTDWWAGGFHPLHGASPAVTERLIRAGAAVDACAASHLDRIDLLRAILDADPARVDERGGDGQTPLHFARSPAVADLLLERGADIDARDVDHRSTPAQWMLERRRGAGRYDMARHLVERGATADIFLAAALGLTDRLRALLESDPALVEQRTGQGEYAEEPPSSYHIYFWTIGHNRSPAQVAAQFGHADALELLRTFAGPKQLFLEACAAADGEEVRRLLRAHPQLLRELTPADQAALADAAWAGNARAVELMMDLGFDPAARGHDGGTALHCAAWNGSVPCVAAILRHERGSQLVTDRDPHYDSTPLGWCCHGAMHCGNPAADHGSVARLLLEAGADPPVDTGELPDAVRQAIREHAGQPPR
ncbi:MAG: ankyrin repeat domain-containing protein [Gemmatimonadetes bacterium]|nr:ankyrin repeat domain-containing protein [Gemmatimonadota bacterium]